MNTEKRRWESHNTYNINKHDIKISNSLMDCRIFWARIVSSENESLLTNYTKHTFYEIQYALEGHIGIRLDGGGSLYVAESDFVVIPPDTYHQVVDADSKGARFIMAFSLDIKDMSLLKAEKALYSLKTFKETDNMRELIAMLLRRSERESVMGERIVYSMTESFLLEILEAVSVFSLAPVKLTNQGTERIRDILELIKKSNGIGIKVRDIADYYNISERHLCRIFQNEIGKSPRDVINHEKLKKIEEYIKYTKLNLSEISELCGFSDEYAMNKFFKKLTNTTLSDFSRLAKGKPQNAHKIQKKL